MKITACGFDMRHMVRGPPTFQRERREDIPNNNNSSEVDQSCLLSGATALVCQQMANKCGEPPGSINRTDENSRWPVFSLGTSGGGSTMWEMGTPGA